MHIVLRYSCKENLCNQRVSENQSKAESDLAQSGKLTEWHTVQFWKTLRNHFAIVCNHITPQSIVNTLFWDALCGVYVTYQVFLS